MMKAIVFDRFGATDVLHQADLEVPQPGAGQVRVRVKAAGLNALDGKIRSGMMEALQSDHVRTARAFGLSPWRVVIRHGRVVRKNLGKAIADYDRVIQLAPQDADTYNNRGNAYRELKEYQKAISDYDRALQLDPNYTLAKDNRELAYRLLREKKLK